MIIQPQQYLVNDLRYIIRSAVEGDAEELSRLRVQIDGETENLDRERGEGFIDEAGFRQIIRDDSKRPGNLFLTAEAGGRIVGFSRCEGSELKRLSHKTEFGICILKDFWGFGMGKNLLQETINWADASSIKKITLSVLETNEKAIQLYQRFGFETEGVLKRDKLLSDGKYYHTIMMARFHVSGE
ncbi:GNAT family N-acetyltransferase [Peribacillus kribbensis]|uniref:GNAT family N-acetyltransferase n=1 Tax=Peribacillus kribbensis TaxID=356658 RepID=UPI00040C7048|nr:GNAT family N-acetyltransferase [Peribacillus kribbensis]